MIHVDLAGRVALPIPSGVEAFAVVLRGAANIDGSATGADEARALTAGRVAALEGHDSAVLVAWSERMDRAPSFAGPFCMFSRARLAEAQQRYVQGGMGRLSPSNVRWGR